MDLDKLVDHLSSMPGAMQDFPFGPEVLVFKAGGKMFALVPLEAETLSVNLKCDPEKAELLREMYPAVKPGYHMNKRHWNTVVLDGSLPAEEVFAMAEDSYDLVVRGLPKAERERLKKTKPK